MSEDSEQSEEHERIQANWDEAAKAADVREFTVRPDAVAWSGLIVALLAFSGILLESKELQLTSAALAALLPALYLAAFYRATRLHRDTAKDITLSKAKKRSRSC